MALKRRAVQSEHLDVSGRREVSEAGSCAAKKNYSSNKAKVTIVAEESATKQKKNDPEVTSPDGDDYDLSRPVELAFARGPFLSRRDLTAVECWLIKQDVRTDQTSCSSSSTAPQTYQPSRLYSV